MDRLTMNDPHGDTLTLESADSDHLRLGLAWQDADMLVILLDRDRAKKLRDRLGSFLAEPIKK